MTLVVQGERGHLAVIGHLLDLLDCILYVSCMIFERLWLLFVVHGVLG